MKKLLPLLLTFFSACNITYQMGEAPDHFANSNYGKGLEIIEHTRNRVVFKHCPSYEYECEYYYFDTAGLYMVDKGTHREMRQDSLAAHK
jgi:hypothetical protein